MIAFLLGFLHLLPGFTSLAQTVVGKIYDSKVAMYQARWGTTRDVAVAAIQSTAATNQAKAGWIQAVSASPVLSFVVVGFAFPFIFYLNKVIVWDLCLGRGSTPPLRYELLTNWGGIIISGLFITSGVAGIASAVINKKG
ncbi:MAG: hypothetical protein KGL39_45330 [Patescibacteria group bacterium]|nr:hypothetical protein [Patescibacteria group bacterium]